MHCSTNFTNSCYPPVPSSMHTRLGFHRLKPAHVYLEIQEAESTTKQFRQSTNQSINWWQPRARTRTHARARAHTHTCILVALCVWSRKRWRCSRSSFACCNSFWRSLSLLLRPPRSTLFFTVGSPVKNILDISSSTAKQFQIPPAPATTTAA